MIWQILTHYYGFDWLAASLTMLMIYFLGNKNQIGFYFGLASNVNCLVFALLASSPPIFISNSIFFVLNIRGIARWKKPHKPQSKESHHDHRF